jgi:hypothetical protein
MKREWNIGGSWAWAAVLALAALGMGPGCGTPPTQAGLVVQFTKPASDAGFTPADDVDPSVPGVQINASVTATDVANHPVTLSAATLSAKLAKQTTPGSTTIGTLQGSGATFSNVTLQTGLNVLTATLVDNAGRTGTGTVEVWAQGSVLATLAVTFVAPKNDAGFTPDDDTNPAEPGLQISASVSASLPGDAGAVTLSSAALSSLSLGTPDAGTSVVAGALLGAGATFSNVTLQPGPNQLTVHVADTTGRVGTGSITVNATGFTTPLAVTFVSPMNDAGFAPSDDTNPSLAGIQINAGVTAKDAIGHTVTLTSASLTSVLTTQVGGGTPLAGTLSGSGATFSNVTVQTGENVLTATVQDDFGRTGTASIDVSAAGVLVGAAFSTITFTGAVAPDGGSATQYTTSNGGSVDVVHPVNWHFYQSPPTSGYVADLDTATAGGQVYATFTVTADAGDTVSISYQDAGLFSQAIASNPQTFTNVPLSLPEDYNSAHSLVFATNDVNAPSSATVSVFVDVTQPTAPGVGAPTLVAGTYKYPQVTVPWTYTAPGAGQDAINKFDLRWTTDLALAGGAVTDSEFFGGFSRRASGSFLTNDGTASQSYTLDRASTANSLPPLNTYWFQVRSVDPVGNESALGAPTTLTNSWNTAVYADPQDAGSGGWGYDTLVAANLNGDAYSDLVLADYLENVVDIYYGAADPGTLTPVTLSPPAPGNYFGADLSAGFVVSNKGNTSQDLVVGQGEFSYGDGGLPGAVWIYPGVASGAVSSTPAVGIFGTGSFSFMGYTGCVHAVGDLNGDGVTDLLLTSFGDNGFYGNVYLFYGRTLAQWQALAGSNVVNGIPAVTTAQADFVFSGSSTVTISPPLGYDRGVTLLGDLSGTGVMDFSLNKPADKDGTLYLFANPASGTASPIPVSAAIEVMRPATAASVLDTIEKGFSAAAVGNLALGGSAAPDLVVGYPVNGQVQVFLDGTATGYDAGNPNELIQCGGYDFGQDLVPGDFNGDGVTDLLVGKVFTSGDTTPGAWVMLNHAGAQPFDSACDRPSQWPGPSASGLDQILLLPTTGPTSATSLMFGRSIAVGDFNGDGKPDIALTDPATGLLYLWW